MPIPAFTCKLKPEEKSGTETHHQIGHRMDQLLDQVNLSAEQKQKVEALRKVDQAQVEPLMKTMFTKHHEFMEYLLNPTATKEKSEQKQAELSQLHQQLEQHHMDFIFKLKELLTPEQQQKLSTLHHEKMRQWEQHLKEN
jgi:Spy/CpxP family protein refolding chaperone